MSLRSCFTSVDNVLMSVHNISRSFATDLGRELMWKGKGNQEKGGKRGRGKEGCLPKELAKPR